MLQPKSLPHRLLRLHCAEQHQQEGGVQHDEEQGGVFGVYRGQGGAQHDGEQSEGGVQHGRQQGEVGVHGGGDQLQPDDEDWGRAAD